VQLILRIVGGPAQGRRIVIRRGQIAQIGRTEWADFSVGRDQTMADIHFSVEWTPAGFRVTDLKSGPGTSINDESVTSAIIHTGDQIQAGESVFQVDIEGESGEFGRAPSRTSSPLAKGEGPSERPSTAGPSAIDCALHLPLSEAAQELLSADQSPSDYLQLLTDKKLFPDGIRFLAFLLPKPLAVLWCAKCVADTLGDTLSPPQRAAIQAAESWGKAPTEEHRRLAEKSVQELGTGSPAGWVALAAFWSDGSLTPEGLPELPPSPGLTSRAITAALMMVAPHGTPTLATERYRQYLAQGTGRLEKAE
jgi:pSer/pThr/pTyr-binding forkhead associated (FHA) protein